MTPSTPWVPAGASAEITATGTYADGSTQNTLRPRPGVPGNTTVTTVAANGLGSALLAGTATVTRRSGYSRRPTLMTVISAGVVATAVRADLNSERDVELRSVNQDASADSDPRDGRRRVSGTLRCTTAPLPSGQEHGCWNISGYLDAAGAQVLPRTGEVLDTMPPVYRRDIHGRALWPVCPVEVELTSGILGGQENQIEIYVHKAPSSAGAALMSDQSSCPSTTPGIA